MAASATSEESDALKLKADEECEELDRKIELLSSEIVMAEAEIDAMTKQLEAWKGRGLGTVKTQHMDPRRAIRAAAQNSKEATWMTL